MTCPRPGDDACTDQTACIDCPMNVPPTAGLVSRGSEEVAPGVAPAGTNTGHTASADSGPSSPLRPPFSYFGGKTSMAARIADLIPAGEHYVEPFAGSLAVLLAKPPSKYETVNDLNGDLMTFWRVLRDRPDDLIRACSMTPHGRQEHEASFEPSHDDLEHARRVWVRLSQGRTSRLTPTGWRQTVKPVGTAALPTYLAGYVGRMQAVAERLARVSLECRPAIDLIEKFGAHEGVVIYADPPYLVATRNGTNYAHEMATDDDHQQLAGALRRCKAAVVLSGYHSPLYDEMYAGWHVTEIAASTRQGNHGASRGSARVEVLWSNRPLATASLDLTEATA